MDFSAEDRLVDIPRLPYSLRDYSYSSSHFYATDSEDRDETWPCWALPFARSTPNRSTAPVTLQVSPKDVCEIPDFDFDLGVVNILLVKVPLGDQGHSVSTRASALGLRDYRPLIERCAGLRKVSVTALQTSVVEGLSAFLADLRCPLRSFRADVVLQDATAAGIDTIEAVFLNALEISQLRALRALDVFLWDGSGANSLSPPSFPRRSAFCHDRRISFRSRLVEYTPQ